MATETTSTLDTPSAGMLSELVQLDRDHPGFRDAAYRARRNYIASLALHYRPGDPVPRVDYTPEEQEVWRTVWRSLGPLHERFAAREYLECKDALGIDREHVPQLADLNPRLFAATGFRMLPVAGLVTSRMFLGQLARDTFLSTQYMRHPSTPLYTPEPDVVHELVGHAAALSHPGIAAVNRAFGRAIQHVSEDDVELLNRVYWYTVEFGVVKEPDGFKAWGAGLLSSFGELGRFSTEAELRPIDIDEMTARPYDPTGYQPVLFYADSFAHVVEVVTSWLNRF